MNQLIRVTIHSAVPIVKRDSLKKQNRANVNKLKRVTDHSAVYMVKKDSLKEQR